MFFVLLVNIICAANMNQPIPKRPRTTITRVITNKQSIVPENSNQPSLFNQPSTSMRQQNANPNSRGKDLVNLKKTIKRTKHRAGLSRRIDMHFDDVKESSRNILKIISRLTLEIESVKKMVNENNMLIKTKVNEINEELKIIKFKKICCLSDDGESIGSNPEQEDYNLDATCKE